MRKIFILLAFTAFLMGCEDDGNNFERDLDSGWVQFPSNNLESTINLGTGTNTLEVPLDLQTTTNIDGLKVNYTLQGVNGSNPSDVLSGSGVVTFAAGTDVGSILLNINNSAVLSELGLYDIVLTSTNRGNVKVGLNDGTKPISHRVNVNCAPNVSSTYTGDGFSNDAGVAPGSFPSYTSTFTPVAGETNMWTLDTTWGPDFVTSICGGCVPPGSFPYPSTVILNNDNTVTVTSTDPNFTGGSGTYNTCDDVFTLNIGQALFTNPFTVDVVLTGN